MFKEKYRSYINWAITVIAILFAGIAFYFLFLRWSGIVATFKTLGGILCEVFSLCSIFIGMFRHDRKKQEA